MKFAHLSDLHFGKLVSTELLSALREDLHRNNPELLVVTGDLTNRGKPSEFKWALSFLKQLQIPYISIPGNREIGISAFWEWMFPRLAMNRYRKFFGNSDKIVLHKPSENILFIGLNSVHPFPPWPGGLKRETRYWLADLSANNLSATKIIFLHHPVMPVTRSSSFWAHTFTDAGALLQICAQSKLTVILQGHKHRSAVMEVNLPETSSKIIVSCAGAPLTLYWDPAYNIIEITDDSVRISVRNYLKPGFDQTALYSFTS